KIGNRIALMEGGRIVQVGTARQIIANPVSDYVADFVAHMNPLNVLTAADVMEPGGAGEGPQVPPATPVRQVMEMLAAGAQEVTVAEGGIAMGVVRPGRVLSRLVAPRG
ncbi:MAG TPA: choline ABC transporter ATP-binding protein, partial [Paracoccaceae bacterium]|nr:choline ABC transporter ATP-binding protein [Paracoccaceae bacterium]